MADFEMFSGDTKTLRITCRDAAGIAINLTGASARWWMAKSVGSSPSAVLINKSTEDVSPVGIAFFDEFAGILDVYLDPGDTEELKGSFYHECEVILANGAVGTVVTGKIKIKQDLVR